MVPISKGSIWNGTTMEVVIPNYYDRFEETYGIPLFAVHRVDLHNQLRQLATQEEGIGRPVEIQVRARVNDYVSSIHSAKFCLGSNTQFLQDAVEGRVTLEDGKTLQADLIIAADGVHTTAVGHVLNEDKLQVAETGWSCMRWLVPTEEILSDLETADLVKDSVQRFFMPSSGSGGLVWYPCRKYVVISH